MLSLVFASTVSAGLIGQSWAPAYSSSSMGSTGALQQPSFVSQQPFVQQAFVNQQPSYSMTSAASTGAYAAPARVALLGTGTLHITNHHPLTQHHSIHIPTTLTSRSSSSDSRTIAATGFICKPNKVHDENLHAQHTHMLHAQLQLQLVLQIKPNMCACINE